MQFSQAYGRVADHRENCIHHVDFTKRKAAVRCLHYCVHMHGSRKMVVQICKTMASASVVQTSLIVYVLQHSCDSHVLKWKVIAG